MIKLRYAILGSIIPMFVVFYYSNNIIDNSHDYYFVHSYYFECQKNENILAETQYGISFTSIVGKENIYGVQFHPEKSSSQGLNLLKKFLTI